MTPDQQIALWAMATILPFGINGMFTKNPDAIGIGGMLVIGWCMERVCWTIWTPPEATQLYCLMDLAFGVTVLLSWLGDRRPWKLILVALFIFQCALAAAFWGAYPTDTGFFRRYIELNNTAYALELAVTALPGVGCVAGLVGHWLFDPAHAGRHAGP